LHFMEQMKEEVKTYWELPAIAHFCSLFRIYFKLEEFDIETLEKAFLLDEEFRGTGKYSTLILDIMMKLMKGLNSRRDVTMFDFNKVLHRIFSWGWEAAGYGCNPFGPDPSLANFHDLPLYARIKIVYTLCELRLLKSDIESMFKDINSDCLRLLPLGEDRNGITYWYFYGTRLYGEYPDLTVKIRPEKSKKRGRPKRKEERIKTNSQKTNNSNKRRRSKRNKGQKLRRSLRHSTVAEQPSESESVPEEVSDYEGSDHENTDEETSFGSTKRDRNSSETSQTEYYAAESAPVYPRVGAALRTTASISKDVDDEGETNSLNDMVHCTYNSDYDDSNVGMDDNEAEYGNVHNVCGIGSGESSVVVKEEPVDEQSLLKLENLQAVKNCWDPNNDVIKKETAEQEVKINLDDFHAQSTFSCNVDLPSEISRTADTACERMENKNDATKDSCMEETKTEVVNEEKNRPNVKETSCAVANNSNNNNQAWNQPSLIPPTRTRWFVKCDTMQDWHDFVNTLAKSSYANERHLHSLLSENFLTEIESFFIQKNQPSQIEVQQSLLNVASHYETNPIIEETYEPEEETSEVSRQLRPRVRTVRLDDGDGSAESGDEEGGVKNTSSMSREMRYKQREIEKEKGEKLRERAKEERARRLELRLKRQELLAEGRDLSEDVLGRAASSVNYAYTNELDIQMELEHMYGQLEKLIDSFKESPDAWPFLEPVTEDIAPGYFQKIKNPMDLHTIEAKLYSREYRNKIEFIEDVNAMLINCLEFNGLKNDYTKMAQRLERTFIRLWKRYFPPSRSADYDDTYEDELTCVSMLGVLDRKIKDLVQEEMAVLRKAFESEANSRKSLDGAGNSVHRGRKRPLGRDSSGPPLLERHIVPSSGSSSFRMPILPKLGPKTTPSALKLANPLSSSVTLMFSASEGNRFVRISTPQHVKPSQANVDAIIPLLKMYLPAMPVGYTSVIVYNSEEEIPKSDTPCIEISNIICQQSSLPKQAIKVNTKLFIKFSLDRPNERILISSVGTPGGGRVLLRPSAIRKEDAVKLQASTSKLPATRIHCLPAVRTVSSSFGQSDTDKKCNQASSTSLQTTDSKVSVAPVIQVSATHGVRSVGQKLILLQSNPLVIRDNAAVVNNNSNSGVNFTSEAASAITLRTGETKPTTANVSGVRLIQIVPPRSMATDSGALLKPGASTTTSGSEPVSNKGTTSEIS
ncbi:Cat eye syndrome critical region protein 2, partial [Trichinella sp. T6]